MSISRILINGELLSCSDSFSVINPARGEVFAQAPECDAQMLDAAVSGAHQAFSFWRQDISKRREALMAMAAKIQQHSAEIAHLLTLEQGKPLKQANSEVLASVIQIQMAANAEIPIEVLQDNDQALVKVIRKPYGVVAAITPWNYPVSIAMGKIATALVVGNTVVLKPSPFTPLSTLKIAELIKDDFPAGVLNIICGSDPLGASLTAHPAIRKIDFTGSVATGKKVAAAAAPDLKRITLELGGNDPAIVLADSDPEKIAKQLFWGAFTNSGQVCAAIKRIYVHESIKSDLEKALVSLAEKTRVGNGLDAETRLGPVNNKAQFERVKELVNDVRETGGTVLTGGDVVSEQGYCYQNTIVTDVADTDRIVVEEQFGPVVPILAYSDLDDAIARANNSHFGLDASIWSDNVDKAAEVAVEMQTGTAWVNQHLALTPLAPFGGSKCSGIGSINGKWGLEGATELQVINIKRV